MSTAFLPAKRPRITRDAALSRLPVAVDLSVVTVAAFRGYYHDEQSANRRGVYDDCMVIIGPEHFSAYNANVDPSAFRTGMANLKPGVWRYKPGIHGLSKPKAQRYQAYVQAGPVTVIRDGKGPDTGWFGINIHRGGNSGTSSLGCQTIPPAQWEAFRSTLNDQLKRAGQRDFQYILT
jgi:lysozyme